MLYEVITNALLHDPRFSGAAVLVNEFGAVGIDAALVRGVDEMVVTLATGCICCAMRGEMITALRDLHFRRVKGEVPEFRRLIIETTGLADPAPIVSYNFVECMLYQVIMSVPEQANHEIIAFIREHQRG